MPASPSTDLYTLGRGILSIREWVGTTPPNGAWKDLGNCPDFNIEVTKEDLPHYSSRSGIRSKDKTTVLETGYNLNLVLDEISMYNLKMFLRGTISGGNIIRANTDISKEFNLKFVSDNAEGPNQTWEFWKAKLSPASAFNLISNEWAKLEFNGEGLSDATNHSTSPFFNVTYDTTTTTTSTSTTT